VLKKTGIVVAAAATGLLALSPLAFADTTNTQSDNTTNDCALGQDAGATRQSLTGGDSGLLGAAGLVTGVVAPVTAQTQAANCTNIVSKTEDNENSNNHVRTDDRTRVDHSFNTTTSDDDGPFGPGFPFN
jgi:hypothetical protein